MLKSVQQYLKYPYKLILDERVGHSSRTVYGELLSCARKTDVVSIGRRLIGKKLGMKEKTVAQCIKELADAGYVKTISGGAGRRNSYQMVDPETVTPEPRQVPANEIKSLPRHVNPKKALDGTGYWCSRKLVNQWVEAQKSKEHEPD